MLMLLTLALGAAFDSDTTAQLQIEPSREARLLRCAKAPPGSAECFDTAPPEHFQVRFWVEGASFSVRVHSAWAPIFAQRFWQLTNLDWWRQIPIYRNDYVNASFRFVSQFGLSGIPAVDAAWNRWKVSNATAPALQSNERGTVSFSMGAIICEPGNDDPCAALRPNCTADDYCALNYSTEIFVNYANNSRAKAATTLKDTYIMSLRISSAS